MAGERETAVEGSCHYNSRSLLNSREVWFGESHHPMLLWAFKNAQNDELYQVCPSQFWMASVMDGRERMQPEMKRKVVAVQTLQSGEFD
jgi:hypothetical protein